MASIRNPLSLRCGYERSRLRQELRRNSRAPARRPGQTHLHSKDHFKAEPAPNEPTPAPDDGQRLSIKEIIRTTWTKHKLNPDLVMGGGRMRALVYARQELMWRPSKEGFSLTQISRALGRFDWTTVQHGVRRHQARLDAGMTK